MDAITLIASFLIIAAFIIGGYSMFRISEHYNKEFRRIIEERTEARVIDEIFDVEPEKPKRPQPRPVRKQKPVEVKTDD